MILNGCSNPALAAFDSPETQLAEDNIKQYRSHDFLWFLHSSNMEKCVILKAQNIN